MASGFKNWRWGYWPEGLVLALGLGLYGFQLGQESLWIDEILSIGSAQGRLDLNRPLYFVLLRGWLRFGGSEVWLRSLSVLFGLGCLGLTYALGRYLAGRRVGLVAGVLFALSPLAINHAQEVRFYMMSACLGVAGSLCLGGALRRPGAWSLGGWIGFRCLGFLTAQPNLLLVVADFAAMGGSALGGWALPRPFAQPLSWRAFPSAANQRSWGGLRRWGWALGLLVVPMGLILRDVVGPLVEFLVEQRWYAGTARSPGVGNLVGLWAALTAWPLAGPEGLNGFYQPVFRVYAGLVLVGSVFPVVYRKVRSPQLIWVALWGGVPVALVFLMSQVFPFLWLERYAVGSIPFVAILLAASWVWVWDWRRGVAGAIAIFYFVALSGPVMRYYTADYRADWRGLAVEMGAIAAEESVVVYPGSFLPYINYYYDGDAELVPVEEIESAQDVEAELLLEKVQPLGERFWLACPVKDDWDAARETVFEALGEEGFVLKEESASVNHWNWGPVLYLFEQERR